MGFELEKAYVTIETDDTQLTPGLEKAKAKAKSATANAKASAANVATAATQAAVSATKQTLSAVGLGGLIGGGIVAGAAAGVGISNKFVAKGSPVVSQRFQQATDDLQAVIGRSLTPVIEKATKYTRQFADAFASSNGILDFFKALREGRGAGDSLGAAGVGSQVTSANSYSQFLTNAALRSGGQNNGDRVSSLTPTDLLSQNTHSGKNAFLAKPAVGGRN